MKKIETASTVEPHHNVKGIKLPEEFAEIASVLQLDAQLLGDYSVKAINGRNLQRVLNSTKDHTTWAKTQIQRLSLEHGIDYEILSNLRSPSEGSTNSRHQVETTYCFPLEVGKTIAMISNAEKGNLVRKYFLHMELVAQEAYRGELPVIQLPIHSNEEMRALEEFDYYAKVLTSALSGAWSQGYVQKSISMAAVDVDHRHGTHITRLIPAPVALPGQKEEIDITKGEHMLRQTIGSKEM